MASSELDPLLSTAVLQSIFDEFEEKLRNSQSAAKICNVNEERECPDSLCNVSFSSPVHSTSNECSQVCNNDYTDCSSCSNSCRIDDVNESFVEQIDIDINRFTEKSKIAEKVKLPITQKTLSVFSPASSKIDINGSSISSRRGEKHQENFSNSRSEPKNVSSKDSADSSVSNSAMDTFKYLKKTLCELWPSESPKEEMSNTTKTDSSTVVQINVIHLNDEKNVKCSGCKQKIPLVKSNSPSKSFNNRTNFESQLPKTYKEGKNATEVNTANQNVNNTLAIPSTESNSSFNSKKKSSSHAQRKKCITHSKREVSNVEEESSDVEKERKILKSKLNGESLIVRSRKVEFPVTIKEVSREKENLSQSLSLSSERFNGTPRRKAACRMRPARKTTPISNLKKSL